MSSKKAPLAQGPAGTSVRAAKKAAAGGVSTILNDNITFAHIGWQNLNQKFQELFALLNAPSSGLNASEARKTQKEQVSKAIENLLEMAQQECRRLLVEGDAKAAIEGGLRTLKLKEQYYGVGSLQLVPAYFHLARTNQYIDKFKPAEEFLSLAQWTLLKHQEADVSLRAELHQTFGLLYASDGKLDVALKHLATATYYLAVMNGPEHILTSFGYFDLGNVFAAKANMDCAMAYYEKVKSSWRAHLEIIINARAKGETVPVQHSTPMSLGEENVQDAQKMLRGIVGLQSERYGKVHQATGTAELVLGLYLAWLGDITHAFDSLCLALEIHKRLFGERHSNTIDVKVLMTNLSMDIPDDTSHTLDAKEEDKPAEAKPEPERPESKAADPTEDLHPQAHQSQEQHKSAPPKRSTPTPPPAHDNSNEQVEGTTGEKDQDNTELPPQEGEKPVQEETKEQSAAGDEEAKGEAPQQPEGTTEGEPQAETPKVEGERNAEEQNKPEEAVVSETNQEEQNKPEEAVVNETNQEDNGTTIDSSEPVAPKEPTDNEASPPLAEGEITTKEGEEGVPPSAPAPES